MRSLERQFRETRDPVLFCDRTDTRNLEEGCRDPTSGVPCNVEAVYVPGRSRHQCYAILFVRPELYDPVLL